MFYTRDRDQWITAAVLGAERYSKPAAIIEPEVLSDSAEINVKVFMLRLLVNNTGPLNHEHLAAKWGMTQAQFEGLVTVCHAFVVRGQHDWAWKTVHATICALPAYELAKL